MQYQTFTDTPSATYPVAFLVPKPERDGMVREYLQDFPLPFEEVIAYKLFQTGKKTKAVDQKAFLDELLPMLEDMGTKYLIISDSDYFKTLTGMRKADPYLGYAVPNTYPAALAGRFNVFFCPNFRQVFYNPEPTRAKIKLALDALVDHRLGSYREPGHGILKMADYPSSLTDIRAWLGKLIDMDRDLSCDIEGFSLHHVDAGIGTISFSWDKHEGIAFAVDLGPAGKEVRKALRTFFENFRRRILWHHAGYDLTVLIYQLFMDSIIDTKGLLRGLEVMCAAFEDTKLIAYLATNSCAGNKLGLKEQAQEFAGNYAVDEIEDITQIPLPELLEYNLVDACSTWFVHDKHWETMVADEQLEIYEELFKPALIDIIQMQLTGMPVDMDEVAQTRVLLQADYDDSIKRIRAHMQVREFEELMNQEAEQERYDDWCARRDAGVKVRAYTPGKQDKVFNPNSAPQVQRFFYEFLGLPVIERTKSKLPATSAEVLEKLKAFTDKTSDRLILDAMLDFKAVEKILGTFIPALENARQGPDGWHYLFGSFNLGGTVSGRLSSSKPNLQNLPSNGDTEKKRYYAKLIKKCFKAPPGWLMVGLDFDSLEDRISALTTRDPEKLKVYEDGYDGHCLRAYSYFQERMPDIDPNSVDSINSIKKKYPTERQDSKTPTFALTYQGTYLTLIAKCGFTEVVAKQIEHRYHQLYRVSDEWVAAKLDEASRRGYITAAFGLRIRTPLLAQVIRGNQRTPHEAEAEGRTAGNALGQSWCLLNSRASVEFMRKVRQSAYRLLIRPIAHIHDAQYYLIPDDIEVLHYVNKHLVAAVQWQDHPDIAHPVVKLGGKLSLFHPSWASDIEIPNAANDNDVFEAVQKALQKKDAA